MAINFPDSPSLNDTYTVDDKTFIWTGDYWRVLNSPNYISTLIKDADNDTKIEVEQSADEDTVRITTAGTERYSIGSAGHIIPTANETYDLGSSTNRFRDLYLSGSSIDLGGVTISSDGTSIAMPPVSNISGDFTVDTDTLHVDSANDRVGIGTTSPASTLSVAGINSETRPLLDLQASLAPGESSAYQRGIRLLNSGMSAGDELLVAVGRSDNTRNQGQMYFQYSGDGSTSNRLSFGLYGVDDVLNVMGSGNVGIGTTSPSHELDVTGTVNATSYVRVGGEAGLVLSGNTIQVGSASSGKSLSLNAGASNRVFINSSGNVGINDTTPSYTLDVNGDSNAQGYARSKGKRLGMALVFEGSLSGGTSTFLNVFNSDWNNYRVVIDPAQNGSTVWTYCRFVNSSNVALSSGYYSAYVENGTFGRQNNQSAFVSHYASYFGYGGVILDITLPLGDHPSIHGTWTGYNTGGFTYDGHFRGFLVTTDDITGIQWYNGAPYGSVRIYGY